MVRNPRSTSQSSPPAKRQRVGLFAVGASLLEDPKYADLEIRCQEKVYKVHQNIVCLQSKVLARCVDGGFLEASTKVIKLDDDIPEIVEHFLRYLYTGDYDYNAKHKEGAKDNQPSTVKPPENDTSSASRILGNDAESGDKGGSVTGGTEGLPQNTSAESVGSARETVKMTELLAHTLVYTIADKFDVPGLKEVAVEKFKEALARIPNPLDVWTEVVRAVYGGTPESDRGLKDIAALFSIKNCQELLAKDDFVKLCEEKWEIGMEILRELVKDPRVVKQMVTVPNCERCKESPHVRISSKIDQEKSKARFYCTKCRYNFNV
ncbi:hypothetical protein HYFRA_00013086 [Hymenoscyphus fraxineus]|uniref:BTB domain-containing protein n=1 Tax=Hymenoscyphus fraxineus TaxID=746836 RepID=A0A9N9PTN0_9HELO|nr:hypothetical protein HYFRA_00013086 [Hymenoscyphus fraxineus]